MTPHVGGNPTGIDYTTDRETLVPMSIQICTRSGMGQPLNMTQVNDNLRYGAIGLLDRHGFCWTALLRALEKVAGIMNTRKVATLSTGHEVCGGW